MGKPRYGEVLNTGYCRQCGSELVQRDAEPYYNWRKRRTCNKVCGALYREANSRGEKTLTPIKEAKFHVRRIERGTHEFAVLAAQYSRK